MRKFAVHGGEQQATFVEANEIYGHFSVRKRHPNLRPCLHLGDGDVESEFTVPISTLNRLRTAR